METWILNDRWASNDGNIKKHAAVTSSRSISGPSVLRFIVFLCLPFLMMLQSEPAEAAEVFGNPSNYLKLIRTLNPGDTLVLEPGIYHDPKNISGLPVFNVHGEPGNPIVIRGAGDGPRPIFKGRSKHNTVRFDDASYIEIRHLEIDGQNLGGDGINAQGLAHHITLEDIFIYGVGNDQQTVGISTNKSPTWNWVIRNNTIQGAGTGMYLGNSDGRNPFVWGIIENNLLMDTIGYNIEIKHQLPRPTDIGMPTGPSQTIIRNNVFTKSKNSSTSKPRPNLLVGHFPLSGPGKNDTYEIYGNFFYQNPTEALFQGEGNVALYNNLFFTSTGNAVIIQPHKDVPREIRVFNNTIVARGRGIRVIGGSRTAIQKVLGNAVFAGKPIQANDPIDNITDSFAAASKYLNKPLAKIDQLDLYPKRGKLTGPPLNMTNLKGYLDWNRDFNGRIRSGTYRGAYAGGGMNPGWRPVLEPKPTLKKTDSIRPGMPTDLRIK